MWIKETSISPSLIEGFFERNRYAVSKSGVNGTGTGGCRIGWDLDKSHLNICLHEISRKHQSGVKIPGRGCLGW